MSKDTIKKLNMLIESRQVRAKEIHGEIWVVWGVLNIIAMSVNLWVFSSFFVWFTMMGIGVTYTIVYGEIIERKDGEFKINVINTVFKLWMFLIVLVIPIIFYVFPVLLRLYNGEAILPLLLIMLSIAMIATGFLAENISFKIGGLVFIICSVLSAKYIESGAIIYLISMFFGLTIPGYLSRYEKKRY